MLLTSGQSCKSSTIVIYDSWLVNYERKMFIRLATGRAFRDRPAQRNWKTDRTVKNVNCLKSQGTISEVAKNASENASQISSVCYSGSSSNSENKNIFKHMCAQKREREMEWKKLGK